MYEITDLVSFFFNGSIAGLVFLIVLLFAIFICCLRRKLPSGVPKPSICTTVKVSHYWWSKLTISVTDFAILVSLGENWLTSGEMTFSKFKSFTVLGRSFRRQFPRSLLQLDLHATSSFATWIFPNKEDKLEERVPGIEVDLLACSCAGVFLGLLRVFTSI